MLRTNIQVVSRRFYQDAAGKRLPLARPASSRYQRVTRRRLDNEAQPTIRGHQPTKTFEPFPFAVTEENKVELFRRLISPLHDIPYEQQLDGKQAHCRNSLRRFAQQLYRSGTPVRLDVRRLPCPVNPIVRAPEVFCYRNKAEFNIWRGIDGRSLTVGHNIFPISKHGDTVCVEPNECLTTRESTIKLVNIFQEFMRTHSKLGCCFTLGQEGGWRRIIVRQNLENELMAIGFLSPRTLKVSEVLEERDKFKDFMVRRSEEAELKLKSLYYQPAPHASSSLHKDCPYELLHGSPKLEEKVNNLTLAFSPESFMHENTKGSEVFYQVLRQTLDECFSIKPDSNEKPLIINNPCGAGALSLHLADLAEHVVGVDWSNMAVQDAKENAKRNGIENVDFINANLEIALEKILDKFSPISNETVVVCDVKKNGLHRSVVETLRHSRNVSKIVYSYPKADCVNCVDNLMELCSKAPGRSLPPFAPVLATPIDLFPHTESCVLMIALERLPS